MSPIPARGKLSAVEMTAKPIVLPMKASTREKISFLVALAAILVAGFGARLAGIEVLSLWVDEGFTWEVARQGPRAILVALATYDNHPPLHYLLLWAWMSLAGSSELALRFLSVACGIATVALVGWIGRRLFGPIAGLVAAAILALSPFHVWYSQEARSYALLALLASAAMATFILAVERGGRYRWAALAILDALALYTHYYAAFVLAAQGLTALALVVPSLTRRTKDDLAAGRAALLGFLAAAVGAAALFSPWLVALYMQYQRAPHDYAPPIGLISVARNIVTTFAVGEVAPSLGSALVLSLLAFATLGAFLAAVRPKAGPTGRALIILWLLAPIALPFLLATIVHLDLRVAGRMYYIVGLPAYCLLIGRGVAGLGELFVGGKLAAAHGTLLAALVSLALLIGSAVALDHQRATRDKEDFRGVAAYIADREWPGDVIVLNAEYTFRPFNYYYDGASVWHRAVVGDDARVDAALREQTAGASRAWLVLSHDNITDPQGKVRGWLRAHGLPVDESWLNGVGVVCYSLEAHPSFEPVTLGQTLDIGFGGVARLAGAEVPASVPAGGVARLVFAWQSVAPAGEDYHAVALLEDSAGQVRAQMDKIPVAGEYAPTAWKPGEYLVDRMRLDVPRDLPPGEYRLRLFLYATSSGKPLATTTGDDRPIIGTIAIQ